MRSEDIGKQNLENTLETDEEKMELQVDSTEPKQSAMVKNITASNNQEKIEPERGSISIDISSGEELIVDVMLSCESGIYRNSIINSRAIFTSIPRGTCRLKFNQIGATYSQVKDVAVGSQLICTEKNEHIICQQK